MSNSISADVDPPLLEDLKKLRFTKEKETAALIISVDREKLLIQKEEELHGCSVEEIVEALPENSPRYLVLSYEYKQSDGRTSYPLIFIYYTPPGVKMESRMLYASAKTHLQTASGVTKVFDVRDRTELTDAWLQEKLAFFR